MQPAAVREAGMGEHAVVSVAALGNEMEIQRFTLGELFQDPPRFLGEGLSRFMTQRGSWQIDAGETNFPPADFPQGAVDRDGLDGHPRAGIEISRNAVGGLGRPWRRREKSDHERETD